MKNVKLLLLLIAIFAFLLSGCDNKDVMVSFFDTDNNLLDKINVKDISDENVPKVSIPEGYVFEGWSEDYTKAEASISVYPVIRQKEFTVIFYDNNKSEISRESVKYGENVIAPSFLDINGYVQTGWSEDLKSITKDLSVYPILEEVKFLYKFYDTNGLVFLEIESTNLEEKDYPNITDYPNIFDKEIFEFIKWEVSLESQNVFSVKPMCKKIVFQVSIYKDDVQILTLKVNENSSLDINDLDIFEGFEVDKIFLNGSLFDINTSISEDMSLTVTYKVKTYNYVFMNYLGEEIISGTVNHGCDILLPDIDVTRNKDKDYEYVFLNWDTILTNVTSDLVIKPVYEKIQRTSYNVTYIIKDTVYSVLTVNKGDIIEFICPTIEDELYSYIVDDWSLDGVNIYDYDKPVEDDLVLYALYTQVKLKTRLRVNFFNETGKTKLKNVTVDRGNTLEYYALTKEPGFRYTYEFDGWYTNAQKTEKFDFSTKIYDDMDLYANFKAIENDRSTIDLTGKTICFLGDSISTFYKEKSEVNSYYTGTNQYYFPTYCPSISEVSLTWWYQLAKHYNMKIGINNSLSGSSMNSSDINTRINTLDENGKPDVIVIFLGTNDNVNGYVTTFAPAYERALEYIKKSYPDTYVFLATLGYSAYTGYNYTEANRLAFNDSIRSLARKYDAGLIEIDKVQTIDTYVLCLNDNLHPKQYGMNQIFNAGKEAFEKYFK